MTSNNHLYLDFETRSPVDIKHGTKNYLAPKTADIVCLGWKLNSNPTKLWLPGMPPPFDPADFDRVYGHNLALFDRRVWNWIGVPRYGFKPLPLAKCEDSMAICGLFTFPQNLDWATKVLGTPVGKDAGGKRLIKKICCPPFEYTQDELHAFYRYCIQDVDALYHMIQYLPSDHLPPKERAIWEQTVRINERGLPVDSVSVLGILVKINAYIEKKAKNIPTITNGAINTINQTVAIAQWVRDQDIDIPNLQADTVSAYLEREDLPTRVRELLQLRQEMGKSSLAKYKTLAKHMHKGRIYDNLRYYGAATGRWAGMGFQAHNLPRGKTDDADADIQSIVTGTTEDPLGTAKSLIRSMVKAPDKRVLLVADYASIENRILSWLAGDQMALQMFREGVDQYRDMASSLYNEHPSNISGTQRFLGKVLVLGCGYGLGSKGFIKYAQGFGLDISADVAAHAVRVYRQKYRKIPQLWYALKDQMVMSINHPGHTFEHAGCIFEVIKDKTQMPWLRMELPSGRPLWYQAPMIQDDQYGPVPTHMGINSYTRQWSRLKLIPGRITENVVQALARDILAHGKMQLEDAGFTVNLSVHDEVICTEHEDKAETALPEMIRTMCILPDWAEGLPLGAEGEVLKRYKKL